MVDFARLLGITDLSNPWPVTGLKDFKPNSVVARINDRWELLGMAKNMTVTSAPHSMDVNVTGGVRREIHTMENYEASMDVINPEKLLMEISRTYQTFEIGLVQDEFSVKGNCYISSSGIEVSDYMTAKIDVQFLGKPTLIAEASLEQRALKFATYAHGQQMRRYEAKPYIFHPIAVAEIVRTFGGSEEMIAAALLHDVVEDTPVTLDEVRKEFGDKVHDLVEWLTDVSKPTDGNRAVRKQIDLEHIARAPADAKTIKLADIIDNARSIRQHDPDFWKVYRAECGRLLEVMHDVNHKLWGIAADQLMGIDA